MTFAGLEVDWTCSQSRRLAVMMPMIWCEVSGAFGTRISGRFARYQEELGGLLLPIVARISGGCTADPACVIYVLWKLDRSFERVYTLIRQAGILVFTSQIITKSYFNAHRSRPTMKRRNFCEVASQWCPIIVNDIVKTGLSFCAGEALLPCFHHPLGEAAFQRKGIWEAFGQARNS